MMKTRINALPVHSQWALRSDAEQCARENRATYDKLREVCTRGEAPCGGKTVVKQLGLARGMLRFAVVCNPNRLDMDHIALFCDRGDLGFGYRVGVGSVIEIFTE